MKLLVVSPDATSLCTSLEERHAIAIAATDVQEIPDLLNRVEPDAILADLTSLNDNKAHLVITQVKLKQVEQKSRKSMAMVAIVLANNSGERGRAFKMGFAVHIPKPVETIEMVSTLASLIGKDV